MHPASTTADDLDFNMGAGPHIPCLPATRTELVDVPRGELPKGAGWVAVKHLARSTRWARTTCTNCRQVDCAGCLEVERMAAPVVAAFEREIGMVAGVGHAELADGTLTVHARTADLDDVADALEPVIARRFSRPGAPASVVFRVGEVRRHGEWVRVLEAYVDEGALAVVIFAPSEAE